MRDIIKIKQNEEITITDIQEITKYCINLLSHTEYLRRDKQTEEAYTFAKNLFNSIRKLFIASIMHNKKLICVSGLQGAGKTTLMKSFYQLDDQYLNPNLGRGERIPVFITEKEDIKSPSLHAIKIDKDAGGNYIQNDVELEAKDFIDASKGGDPTIMYLELYVPYKHTLNDGISFVLLPGFEKNNDYWNNLIEFSVNSSDAAVFVFNETSFANAENDKYLSIIEKQFGTNLVYAISHSDGSTDNNAEVKQTCIETLKIPSNETDRVVCVGVYANEDKNQAWIQEFKNALEKFAYTETQQFKKNHTYIHKEIQNIKDNLYQILSILNDDNSAEIRSHHDDKLLKEFDKAFIKKRKEFESNLDRQFEDAKKESGKKLEEHFTKRSKLKTMKRLFFGSTVKEQFTEARETIEESLLDEYGFYLHYTYLRKALRSSLTELDDPKNITNMSELIDTKKENGKTILLTDSENTKAMVQDICNLLADTKPNQVNYSLKSNDTKKLLRAIVEIGTYYYGLVSYNEIAEYTGLSVYEPSQTKIIPDNVIEGAKSSKNFVVGLAGIMGIDLIGDGSINMISQIASSLGVSVPVAGTVAATIIGAGATSVILKDLNRMQREDFLSAKLVVNAIYDSLKLDFLEKYDDYMEKIRERIEDNLTKLSGDAKKIIVEYNAKAEIYNALNLLDKISKKSMENEYGLESTFS